MFLRWFIFIIYFAKHTSWIHYPTHIAKTTFPNLKSVGNICGEKSCIDANTISIDGNFIKPETPLTIDDLKNENIVKIVNLECSDIECLWLCWKCLGYLYNNDTKTFESSEKVFPKWAAKYPQPPVSIIARAKLSIFVHC